MIKYVRQKSRENSIKAAKNFLKKKGESNDSGTESDGDILDVERHQYQQHQSIDFDMEASVSSCMDANSPTDTACSSESSAMMCQSHLLYDQHSSEEELEVINGPASIAVSEAAAGNTSAHLTGRGNTSSLALERDSLSQEATSDMVGETVISKRSSSTLNENRKRSLAHSSEDEFRNFLEPILTPVNFRTTPPLEAFKPNKSHMFRSTTPLILSEARCGIENMKLCDNSINDENGGDANNAHVITATVAAAGGGGPGTMANSGIGGSVINKTTSSSIKTSNSSHHIYQPQPKYSFHYNSSRSSPASTTGLDIESVRSVSPPAKLFHCAISPKRRPMRTNAHAGNAAQQRLQRPHRPCLDFDKMQQVSL